VEVHDYSVDQLLLPGIISQKFRGGENFIRKLPDWLGFLMETESYTVPNHSFPDEMRKKFGQQIGLAVLPTFPLFQTSSKKSKHYPRNQREDTHDKNSVIHESQLVDFIQPGCELQNGFRFLRSQGGHLA